MKIRKLALGGMVLVGALCFNGCSVLGRTEGIGREDTFCKMKAYEANVCVTLLKDKQPNSIKMKQSVASGDNYEMVITSPQHLAGTILSYDGEKFFEQHPGNTEKIEEKPSIAQNEMLLTAIKDRIAKGEHVKKQEAVLNGEKMITYEVPIEGEFKYLAKEKIWLSQKDFTPVQMHIYDDEGNISIEVIFQDFKYNS